MKIGYARVSTKQQNLELQITALEKFGCDKIYTDKVSSRRSKRKGLEEAFEYLRNGDTLVIWKLDRLGRSLRELTDLSESLKDRNITLHSLTENIDTSNASGRLYFNVLGAVAEMERELNRERVLAGIKNAKDRGRELGRPKVNQDKIQAAKKLLRSNMSYKDVAAAVGLAASTLYKHIPPTTVDNGLK